MNSRVQARIRVERRIVRAILKEAIEVREGTVSLSDGEEWVIKRSNSVAGLMKGIMSTDEDRLRIRDKEGNVIGDVYLIYGNDGWDVIADYSDREHMREILKSANEIADRIQAAS